MAKAYYIDESGNSGDLIKSGTSFDFSGQPIFTLACVGIDDEDRLADKVHNLKKTHGLRAGELKASRLVKRPKLILDLVRYLVGSGAPMFIEVVDKRYVICINMVEHHVLPPVNPAFDFRDDTVWIKRLFVEYLYEHAPETVLNGFLAACFNPVRDEVHASLKKLECWLSGIKNRDEMAPAILRGVQETLEDLASLQANDSEGHLRFLPAPDDGKTGKPIWMLPSLSSFTNTYARINKCHRRRISDVTLFHDEQFYFEEILSDGKIQAEALFKTGVQTSVPHADYEFEEQASLQFVKSEEILGIQVADVLAGFVMRYVKDGLAGKETAPELGDAFHTLIDMTNPMLGTGVNMVVPDSGMLRIGVSWI